MMLLRLSPDGERLRRVAKAHAAGELSTPDYRRIRSDVIESFVHEEGDVTGDDTQQRWLERPPPLPLTTDLPTDVPAAPVRRPRPVMAWLALGTLLLAIAAVVGLASS